MGYDCCQSCDVVYEDASGKWGVENNKWCGIDKTKCNESNAACWSLPTYPCCQGNSIVYSDEQGDWGVENGKWCGIVQSIQPSTCWSEPAYPCCKNNVVIYTDDQGQWGVENGNWCGIIKSSNNDNQQPNNDVPQNNDEPQTPQEDLNLPKFSMESGFYEEKNGLTLTLTGEGTIYYTLDSSNPTTSNTAQTYSSPIKLYDRSVDENVISKHGHQDNSPFSTTLQNPYTPSNAKFDKLNIVRAAVKLADGTWSPVITKSFIVMSSDKLKYYKDIPVVSLVTDPVNLFDKDKGIYVCGQQYLNWKNSPQFNPAKSEWDYDNVANFFSKGKEWERDGAISIFRNGKEELNQNVGIRLKGASTRNHQTKSFNIFARKQYGDSKIKYEVIDDNVNYVTGKKIDKYDSFGIRGVYWFDRMRDNIVQTGLEDSPVIATYNSNRCVLFLDGEFWGLYDLIEKASDYYIESNYGIPKENVALIKNDELEEGTEQDLQDFKDLVRYCSTNDLTNPSNYDYVASKLDLESLIYHYAIGFYLGIWDWPNRNYLVYRNKGEAIDGNPYSDGKWRYGAFDFDYSTGITYDTFGGVEGYAHDSFKKFQNKKDEFPTPIFSGLIKNKTFYKQFSDVMNLMSQKIFEPSKMVRVVEEHKSKYMNYIIETDWRWQSGTPTANYDSFKSKQVGYFTGGWDAISDFFRNRPKYVYNFMEGVYGKP
jgi:Cellulose or protein binding domain./CotH protein.